MGFRNQPVIVLRHLFLGRKRLVFDFPFRREFAVFEAPLLKGHPGALARDSVERAVGHNKRTS